jgi:hypothetical protein
MNRMLIGGCAIAVGAALAAAAVTRNRHSPQPDLTADLSGKLSIERIEERATENFGGLTNAMDECETQARADVDRLYFLAIPLVSVAKDTAQWRSQSINEVGNTILLRSDEALQGLRSGTLRLYPGSYGFRVLDTATNTVYNWKPATGATRMSGLDASAITQFKLQVKIPPSFLDAQWSDTLFYREAGTCYWVNALLGRAEQ